MSTIACPRKSNAFKLELSIILNTLILYLTSNSGRCMLIIGLGKPCISIYKYQCAGKHSTASFLGRRHPGLRYLITVGVNTTTTASFKPRMCGASSRDMGKKLTMDPPPAGPNWRWHPALCKLLSEFVTF